MKRVRTTALVLLMALGVLGRTGYAGPKSTTKIVAQPDAPVRIVTYSADYVERTSTYTEQGIHHRLEYQSSSQKPVAAVQFGLVSFDVFNDFIGRTGGISLEAMPPGGKALKGGWVTRAYGDFAFLTGVAYVQRVRFADGEIWSADEIAIVAELKKIQADFDPSKLKKADSDK